MTKMQETDELRYVMETGKYYEEGMWICYLLDRLMPDWQRMYSMEDIYYLLRDATDA